MKIALVDDDPRALAQLEQYLTEQLGRETEISHYGSGEALLADWQPGAFELVVLDIYMGGATGMRKLLLVQNTGRIAEERRPVGGAAGLLGQLERSGPACIPAGSPPSP